MEAAALEAGQHPERAQQLAADLAIGTQRESILHQALRGGALPPPIHDQYFDAPPAGSFDAGVARVLAEQYELDWVSWVKGNNYKIVGDFPNVVGALQDEVRASFGFARFALMLASGVRLAQEEEASETEKQTEAEADVAKLAAVGFFAGWLMGIEHQEAKQGARANNGGAR